MIRQAFQITKTEFYLRDQGTFLGFLWTLINPVLLFLALYGVFANTTSTGSFDLDFAFYLMAGILFWNFFSGASTVGVNTLSFRPQYLASTTVPLSSLVLGSLFTQFAITFIEATVCLGILALFDPSTTYKLFNFILGILWVCPLALFVALILVWIRRYFLDATRLWELALRIGFFLTPIFYYPQDKPFHSLLKWNPLLYGLQVGRFGFSSIETITVLLFVLCSIAAALLLFFTEKNKALLIEVL